MALEFSDEGVMDPIFQFSFVPTPKCAICHTAMESVSGYQWRCPEDECPENGKPVTTDVFAIARMETFNESTPPWKEATLGIPRGPFSMGCSAEKISEK